MLREEDIKLLIDMGLLDNDYAKYAAQDDVCETKSEESKEIDKLNKVIITLTKLLADKENVICDYQWKLDHERESNNCLRNRLDSCKNDVFQLERLVDKLKSVNAQLDDEVDS